MTGPAGTLAGERDALLAAIEDLDRDWKAGAIDEADYRSLRAAYVARAASVIRALEGDPQPPAAPIPTAPAAPAAAPPTAPLQAASTAPPLQPPAAPTQPPAAPTQPPARSSTQPPRRSSAAPPTQPPAGAWRRLRRRLGRRRSQRALAIGAAACFLAVAAVFSAHLAGVRLPGQSSPAPGDGAGTARVQQELREAYVLGSAGKVRAAVTLYEDVLAVEPHQPEALAYGGWLLRLLGIATGRRQDVRLGDALIAESAVVDPSYPDARAFYGIELYADRHQPGAAVSEFRAFLADHPDALLVKLVAPVARQAFAAAGDAVPGVLRQRRQGVASPSRRDRQAS